MKATPVLAVLLGTFLACVLGATGVLLFFPQQVGTLRWLARFGLRPPPVVHAATFYTSRSEGNPCAPASGVLLVTRDLQPHPLEMRLNKKSVGSDRDTVFAEYVGFRGETRLLFFVVKKRGITVDARIHTDYGDFVGAVQVVSSDVHVNEAELCFDLSVEIMDGCEAVERWQGRLDLD